MSAGGLAILLYILMNDFAITIHEKPCQNYYCQKKKLTRPLLHVAGGPTGGAASGSAAPVNPPRNRTPATGGGGSGGGGSKQRGRTVPPPPPSGAGGGGRGGEGDEGNSSEPEAMKLCFVDAEGDAVVALPEPKGKPLPLLAAKNGAVQMRKACLPVIEAVLAHVNKGVELARQLSLMELATLLMGSRQVSDPACRTPSTCEMWVGGLVEGGAGWG